MVREDHRASLMNKSRSAGMVAAIDLATASGTASYTFLGKRLKLGTS